MQFDPEIAYVLARAFDRAWSWCYRPGCVTIAAQIARPAFANCLVEMARAGSLAEGALANAGLLDLISLTIELGLNRIERYL